MAKPVITDKPVIDQAQFGDITIWRKEGGSIEVSDTNYPSMKAALRDIADKAGNKLEEDWNTQYVGWYIIPQLKGERSDEHASYFYDDFIFQFQYDGKERIAAEERARKKADAKAKDEEYDKKFKNKGLSHSIDFSYGYEFSQSDCLCYKYSGYRSYGNLSPMQLTYTLSYKFNRLISLGIGTGVLYNAKSITIVNDNFVYPNENFQEKRLDVPVFMNLKLNFLGTKIRPYLSLSGGYYILSGTPMGEGGLGCEMRFARHYAFRVQASAALTPWPYFSSKNSPAKYTPAFNTGVKIGFDF